jgi:hypothetical protein
VPWRHLLFGDQQDAAFLNFEAHLVDLPVEIAHHAGQRRIQPFIGRQHDGELLLHPARHQHDRVAQLL